MTGVYELEDRILWERVVRTTIPLKGRALPEQVPEASARAKVEPPEPDLATTRPIPVFARRTKPHQSRLDEPTHTKLAKGKLQIAGRIDLHGLTQGEAHGLLHSFLHRAHLAGLRHVLVITGKGTSVGGDGILRQAVPHWFATPAFRSLVSAYDFAHQSHGGTGAIYVRLRRDTERRKS